MNGRVIFVLLDGLSAACAARCMGWLTALRESGRAFGGTVRCEAPALSRPLYACLLSGRRPVESGIVSNESGLAVRQSFFHLAAAQGRSTAAVAYYWFAELVNGSFDARSDRVTADAALPVQYGLFYSRDSYPDAQVFLDAEYLLAARAPDLLLVHTLGIDCAGHLFGHDSPEYRNAAREADRLLARHMPDWLARGYQIMITSDHGMSADRTHNGDSPEERLVPVWLAGDALRNMRRVPGQIEWRDAICEIMGLKK